MKQVVILGGGYTGHRVTERMRGRGFRVLETRRQGPFAFDSSDAAAAVRLRQHVEPGALVLHSIPVPVPNLVDALGGLAARVVYLSTTGVYGQAAYFVNEHTPAAPRTPRELARADEERRVLEGPWSAMVLRPAAIYGPGRGVHVSMREGRHVLRGDGSNYISRIHVDDLAAICEAALLHSAVGAWPVADEEPCPSREITEFCAALLGLPAPEPGGELPASDTRSANRRVDGRAVLRLLGIELQHGSYRTGIPASIKAEQA